MSYIRNKDGSARDAANIAYRFYSLYEFPDADPSGFLEGSGASTGRLEFEAFQELYLKAKEYNPNNPSIGVIPDYNVEKYTDTVSEDLRTQLRSDPTLMAQ